MDVLSSPTLSALSAVIAGAATGVVLALVIWRGGTRARPAATSASSGRVRLPARAFERIALIAVALGIAGVMVVIEVDDALRHSTGVAASCLTVIAALAWLIRRGGFLALRPNDNHVPGDPGHG